jgi:arsenate reductase
MPRRVLILRTGNSARSQMAEGLLRTLAGERVEVYSAGSKPSQVNPYAIRAMQRRGIDISGQRSKHLNEYLDQPFDFLITVCDQATETCLSFPGRAQRRAATPIFWRRSSACATTLRRNSARGQRCL